MEDLSHLIIIYLWTKEGEGGGIYSEFLLSFIPLTEKVLKQSVLKLERYRIKNLFSLQTNRKTKNIQDF